MSASWFDQVPPESEEDKQQRDLRIRIACGEEVEDFQSGRFKRKGTGYIVRRSFEKLAGFFYLYECQV